jgi:hypothetical protein
MICSQTRDVEGSARDAFGGVMKILCRQTRRRPRGIYGSSFTRYFRVTSVQRTS